jgi:branched-chain amino acid transport system permease protein
MSATVQGSGSRGKALVTAREGSAQHRTFQFVGWGIFALAAVIVPYTLPNFRVSQFGQAIAFGVIILGINLIIGYAGLLSLGHIAFAGAGAYTTMILVNDNRWDYWMTWPVVIVICFAFGVLIGLPALRIKGLYLALITIALAYTFPILLKIDEWGISTTTGGDNGRTITEVLRPPSWARSLFLLNSKNPQQQQAIYQFICFFGVAFVTFLLMRNLIKSRPGRGIIAIRDNQIGAAVSGVPIAKYKVITFGISAAVAGIGGSLLAINLASVGPSSFDFRYAILTLMGLVLGGVATLHGNWIGGILLVFLQDLASRVQFTAIPFFKIERGSPLTQAVFGLILVLVAFFAPGGVMSLCKKLKVKIIRVIPNPPTAPGGEAVLADGTPVAEAELTGAAR